MTETPQPGKAPAGVSSGAPGTGTSDSAASQYVTHLHRLSSGFDSRKSLMALRASLGHRDGWAPEAAPLVTEFLPPALEGASPAVRRRQAAVRRSYFTMGGLFALWHLNHASNIRADEGEHGERNLGDALAALSRTSPIQAEALAKDLVSFSRDQVDGVLHRVVIAMAKEDVRVPWYSLASDLLVVRKSWRQVQRSWAEHYYRTASRPRR
ncbi:type I-E CRISPR-associated protein Cse2/CasB [Micrococcus luteus]